MIQEIKGKYFVKDITNGRTEKIIELLEIIIGNEKAQTIYKEEGRLGAVIRLYHEMTDRELFKEIK